MQFGRENPKEGTTLYKEIVPMKQKRDDWTHLLIRIYKKRDYLNKVTNVFIQFIPMLQTLGRHGIKYIVSPKDYATGCLWINSFPVLNEQRKAEALINAVDAIAFEYERMAYPVWDIERHTMEDVLKRINHVNKIFEDDE